MAVVTGALVLAVYGASLTANFWIIDDHELIEYMGPAHHLAWSQVIPTLMRTEVGQPGSHTRFRPVYQGLRLLGAALLGRNPTAWYGAQLLILGLFLWTVWYLLRPHLGLLGGGLYSLYVLCGLYWPDLFSRLGAGETYAALGTALFALGFERVWRSAGRGKPHRWGWLLVALGMVISVGAKENMPILLIPMGLLLARCLKAGSMDWAAWLLAGFAVLWTAGITLVVVWQLSRSGVDYYLNSTSLGGRLGLVWTGAITPRGLSLYIPALLCAAGWAWARWKCALAFQRELGRLFWIFCGLLCLYLSQYVFYNGVWPLNNRYDFPGMLYLPLMYLTWLLGGIRLLAAAGASEMTIQRGQLAALAAVCILLALHANGLGYARYRTQQIAALTGALNRQIQELGQALRAHPEAAVVLQAGSPLDFEPIASYRKYLRAEGVSNPIVVRWDGPPVGAFEGALERELAWQMQGYARGESPDYAPLSSLPVGGLCYAIRLNGRADEICQQYEGVIPR